MAVFDDFTTDVALPGPPQGWAYVEGADSVYASGGHLRWTGVRAIQKGGVLFGDHRGVVKGHLGSSATAVQPDMMLRWIDSNNWLSARINQGTRRLEIRKKDGGTTTSLATSATAWASATNWDYWAVRQIIGNQITVELWDADPDAQPAGDVTHRLLTVSYTLAGADATKFGAGISAAPAIRTGTNGDTNGDYIDSVLYSDLGIAPANTALPTITTDGTPQVGEQISANRGTWDGSPTSYAYQFERRFGAGAWVVVQDKSATATYTITSGDEGAQIRALVWASNAAGESANPAISAAISVVAPLAIGDITVRLSGGAGNGDSLASIGGAAGNVVASSAGGIFDAISALARTNGQVDYRLIYIRNDHPVQSAAVKAWISQQFGDPAFELAIGVATEPAGTNVAAPADRFTAPAGVAFSAPADVAGGLNLGTLGPGQARGLWLRRTVHAGAPELAAHPFAFSGEVTAL